MWSEETEKNVVEKATKSMTSTGGENMDSEDPDDPAAPQQMPERRERSMSVPCRSSIAESADVETVVTKAKRASTYLWMLLHSKVGCSRIVYTFPRYEPSRRARGPA